MRAPIPPAASVPSTAARWAPTSERYVYDAVGNFVAMQHRGSDPVHPGWTRTYAYGEASLIEDGTGGLSLKTSNRLSSTTAGRNSPPERYAYDAHGNMIRMPHLGGTHPAPNMHWDYRDQLRQTDLGGGGTAYYVYDAAGQRVRKVWEKSVTLVEERVYLGGFEIYRRRQGAERLERETLHVMDDQQRIAVVETRTIDTAGSDPVPQQLIRYQFGNHLGSASLELDDQAQIISYEEYTPNGSTSYQAGRSAAEVSLKRYRYTGEERDEESGLAYHGARYYAPWLGRWASGDPVGLEGGLNLYLYAHNNSVRFNDPEGTDPPDVVTRTEVRGTVITSTQTLAREGLQSKLVTTFDSATLVRTQRLFRRDDNRNPDWTDVTQQALSDDLRHSTPSPSKDLSVEWNMPSSRPEASAGVRAGRIVAETIISEIPPSLVIPYVKDSILTEHFEFTPEGENPYQHWSDTIGRRWSATGARKTSFWLNKVVTVAGAVNAAGSALNSTGKAVSTLKAAARVEALAIKTAARAASRFDLAKPLATNKEMVKGIRELEAGLKGHLPGTALSATHTLTDFQRRALSENVRLVIGRTIPAVKAGAGRQALVNQLANPRFRFLGQVPDARAALIDALKGTGVSLPAGL